MEWWLTRRGRDPIGPVSTELVVRGIAAGKVPPDSLVCEVGGTEWKRLSEIPSFARAKKRRESLPPPPQDAAPTRRPPARKSVFDGLIKYGETPPIKSKSSAPPPKDAQTRVERPRLPKRKA